MVRLLNLPFGKLYFSRTKPWRKSNRIVGEACSCKGDEAKTTSEARKKAGGYGHKSQGNTGVWEKGSDWLHPRGTELIFISLDHVTVCNTQPAPLPRTTNSSHETRGNLFYTIKAHKACYTLLWGPGGLLL